MWGAALAGALQCSARTTTAEALEAAVPRDPAAATAATRESISVFRGCARGQAQKRATSVSAHRRLTAICLLRQRVREGAKLRGKRSTRRNRERRASPAASSWATTRRHSPTTLRAAVPWCALATAHTSQGQPPLAAIPLHSAARSRARPDLVVSQVSLSASRTPLATWPARATGIAPRHWCCVRNAAVAGSVRYADRGCAARRG
jgi:hypothetical protein